MNVTTHTFELPLRHPFRISRESIDTQPTVIVELGDQGHSGYGEATTNRYYGATIERMLASIDRVRPIIESFGSTSPESLWAELAGPLREDPFALCAMDQAAHDLAGKLAGQPLYVRWGGADRPRPVSNYTIGIATINEMIAKLHETPDWPIYKIKLGTDYDLEIIQALRQHTDAVFRVDANCGWTVEQTLRNAEQLSRWNVEFIEQPLPAENWTDQDRLYRESCLPIIADESCQTQDDVARCAGSFHGINIKLVKCGGLTPARRMIQQARELGLRVMVGCMTESTVGISAIAQLLPWLDYVDMDGANLLAHDIATGAQVERGVCRYANAPGTGVVLNARLS